MDVIKKHTWFIKFIDTPTDEVSLYVAEHGTISECYELRSKDCKHSKEVYWRLYERIGVKFDIDDEIIEYILEKTQDKPNFINHVLKHDENCAIVVNALKNDEELQLKCLKHFSKFAKFASDKVCLKAIELNGKNIKFVQEQTKEMQMIVLQKEYPRLKDLKIKREDVLDLIQISPKAILCVEDPTEEMLWKAITKNGILYWRVKIPASKFQRKLLEEVIKKDPYLITKVLFPDEELAVLAIKSNEYAIKYCYEYLSKSTILKTAITHPKLACAIRNGIEISETVPKEFYDPEFIHILTIVSIIVDPTIIRDYEEPSKEYIDLAYNLLA